jgi:hypothetical protein
VHSRDLQAGLQPATIAGNFGAVYGVTPVIDNRIGIRSGKSRTYAGK